MFKDHEYPVRDFIRSYGYMASKVANWGSSEEAIKCSALVKFAKSFFFFNLRSFMLKGNIGANLYFTGA